MDLHLARISWQNSSQSIIYPAPIQQYLTQGHTPNRNSLRIHHRRGTFTWCQFLMEEVLFQRDRKLRVFRLQDRGPWCPPGILLPPFQNTRHQSETSEGPVYCSKCCKHLIPDSIQHFLLCLQNIGNLVIWATCSSYLL